MNRKNRDGAAGSTVLVLDGDQRSALATVRSLGRAGLKVLVGGEKQTSLAGVSRYALKQLVYPSPSHGPQQFLEVIETLVRSHGVGVVLPVTEVTTQLLAAQPDALAGAAHALPTLQAFETLSDKALLVARAKELGVPVPRTRIVTEPAAARAAANAMGFPVVVKPARSRVLTAGAWRSLSVKVADSPESLARALAVIPVSNACPVLLQERVGGFGAGVFVFTDGGESKACFAHRRLRERPPTGGVSVLSESVAIDPAMGRYAESLVEAPGWRGAAMVEFKIAEDGTPYLMEINARPWGSLQLAVDAGLDIPLMLYRQALGLPVDYSAGYRQGARLRWLLGDLDRLYLIAKNRPKEFSLFRECLAFLNPGWPRTRYEVNRFGDMGPFFHELRGYVRR